MRIAKLFGIGLFWIVPVLLPAAETNSVLISNVTVHPVTAPEIRNGSVLVIDGKVAEVGAAITYNGPPLRTVDGHGLDLYPGLINAATNIGLSEISSVRDTVDLDEIGLFNPELKAQVAYNPSSEHIDVTRASGITTVISLPGSGASGFGRAAGPGTVITGQGALMHLQGWTWEEAAIKPSAVMEMLFPQVQTVPRQVAAFLGTQPRTFTELDKEYRQRLQQLRDFLSRRGIMREPRRQVGQISGATRSWKR
jgi:imidazolonepropionase-like amidohydrolase